MFRFRLGPIPVQVHFSHLLVSAIFAYSFLPGPRARGSEDWPFPYLADPSHPRYAATVLAFVLLWMAVIFVSVLVHELGHAAVSYAFGYRPSVVLEALGGHTQPNAPGEIPWHKDVLLTLAGPGFGLLLAALAWMLAQRLEAPSAALFTLTITFEANIFWAALNLLPVLPLDGGRICNAVLMRVFGRRGFLLAQGVGLLLAGAIVVWGALHGSLFMALLFGFFAARAFSMISAYLRGELPPKPEEAEAMAALAEAEEANRAGRREEARRLAKVSLDFHPSAAARSRAHYLLGWMALKEGDGRAALDHFSQVDKMAVEPHAVAAGFSLLGDDARALPLWEKAYRQTRDPTVLHEWAGALIRLGREREAFDIPEVRADQALRCAERVLFLRGKYVEAAQVGEAALLRAPSPEVAYDTACAYARAGDAPKAMALLYKASSLGFSDAEYAANDADLSLLHPTPEFVAWTSSIRESAAR